MFLALKEIRRAKARFGLLMAAVGLLVFLILFQQTLQNGLLDGAQADLRVFVVSQSLRNMGASEKSSIGQCGRFSDRQ